LEGLPTGTFDSEFINLLTYPGDSSLTQSPFMIDVEIDFPDPAQRYESVCVVSVIDESGNNLFYAYNPLRLHRLKFSALRNYRYAVTLPALQHESDEIKVYLLNKKREGVQLNGGSVSVVELQAPK
jgi:hypothetical protein